jgi:hypothetical protein
LNLEPGTTITIRVDQTGSAQANVAPNAGTLPEDRVTIGSGELSPSRFDELNAKYSSQYPGASSVLKPTQAQAFSKTPQATSSQLKRLQPAQNQAQGAGWLPPSSFTDIDRTLERYYITPSAPAQGWNQSDSQVGLSGMAADTTNIPFVDQQA